MTTLSIRPTVAAKFEMPQWVRTTLIIAAMSFITFVAVDVPNASLSSGAYGLALILLGYMFRFVFDRAKKSDSAFESRIARQDAEIDALKAELTALRQEAARTAGEHRGRFEQMSQTISTQQVALARFEMSVIEKDARIVDLNKTITEQDLLNERLRKELAKYDKDFMP